MRTRSRLFWALTPLLLAQLLPLTAAAATLKGSIKAGELKLTLTAPLTAQETASAVELVSGPITYTAATFPDNMELVAGRDTFSLRPTGQPAPATNNSAGFTFTTRGSEDEQRPGWRQATFMVPRGVTTLSLQSDCHPDHIEIRDTASITKEEDRKKKKKHKTEATFENAHTIEIAWKAKTSHAYILKMIFGVVGGLGIFLFGMKLMSEGMQAVAGNRLRKMIGAVTNNRLAACGVGTVVTSIIQSSSVTTVMVVGFVNAGFMTLIQAIGVILGANIGTTITGWILALKIGKYGLPLLGVSSFVYLFAKNERVRFTAMAIVGLGMVFFGLETMSAGFKNEQVKLVLETFFEALSGDTYFGLLKCALAGCIATMIVQSSSATLGVTIALAASGAITFTTAAGLILGLNIGTTVTAFLASLGASTNAKRAAYAHIFFNILGTVWLFPIFFWYTDIINALADRVHGDIELRIALTHSGFNIINTIVFLPLMGILAKVVTRIVPDKAHKETPHLTFLDIRMLDTPAIGIQQSQDEIVRMGGHLKKMMGMLRDLISRPESDENMETKLFHREEIVDVVQKEIIEFLSHILGGNISHDVVEAGRRQLRISDEYESISDYIATLLKLRLKLRQGNLAVSKEGMTELLDLHDHVAEYLDSVHHSVTENNADFLSKALTEGETITHLMKDYRAKHIERVSEGKANPLKSLIFTDMLTAYRKIKDHGLNVVQAVAGEK